MKKRTRNYLLGLVATSTAFVGITAYSVSAGPQIQWDSKLVLNEFYVQSQAGNYTKAHALLTSNLGSQLTVPALAKDWKTFEQAHGPIRNWQPMRGRKSEVQLWPSSVQSTYKVTGMKSGAGQVSVRMVKENGSWKIGSLNIGA